MFPLRRRGIQVLGTSTLLSLYALFRIQQDPSSSEYALELGQQAVAHVQAFAFGHDIPAPQPFLPSDDPIAVWQNSSSASFNYDNHPLSLYRPQNQFQPDRVQVSLSPPSIAILTATRNPIPEHLLDAYQSIAQQSLQTFRWVLVDDHSDNQESKEVLQHLANLDSRIIVIRNEGTAGLPASRNVGLDYLAANQVAPYISVFDDDDIYELTCLEKSIWTLASNPSWDLAAFYFVKFGQQNSTETRGPHMAGANLYGNHVPGPTVFRSRAVKECRYDTDFGSGGEDWDFWLCLYRNGHWGGTRPEFGYWYRIRTDAEREARWPGLYDSYKSTKDRILDKYSEALKSVAPVDTEHSRPMEAVTMEAPVENALYQDESPAILFILSALHDSSTGHRSLQLVEHLAQEGWRVTVVVSKASPEDRDSLIPKVMAFTHDVHPIHNFLRARDFPRYITYLAKSRGVSTVLIINSQLGYELLPALSTSLPEVKCIDFIQNQAYSTWRSDGFPAYSLASRRYLHRTLVSSSFLRDWLVENGHVADRIGVVKLSIAPETYSPATLAQKGHFKAEVFSESPNTIIITVVVRLEEKRRPLLLPHILDQVQKMLKNTGSDIRVKMALLGDGPLQHRVESLVKELGLSDTFSLQGQVRSIKSVYAASDIFLLPSFPSSMSVAMMEAMAMALPIVTSKSMRRQLGSGSQPNGAMLVQETGDTTRDSEAFAQILVDLISDKERRESLGQAARNLVSNSDWRDSVEDFTMEIEKARPWTKYALQRLPHPAAAVAISNLILQEDANADLADMQLKIQGIARSGLGRQLQLRCSETSSEQSVWIDNVVKPKACEPKAQIRFKNLGISALEQCGAWCIFDYTTSKKVGWNFQGDCWTAIQTPHACEEWWKPHSKIH